jgi:hypothetical protein
MTERSERAVLAGLLARVRRRIFIQSATGWFVRVAVFLLPLAALLIAADQRWNQGSASLWITVAAVAGLVVASVILGARGLGERVHSALTLDQHAHLKDRISSAWEFLSQPSLTEAQRVQVQDAIHRAEALNCRTVLRLQWPRTTVALPVLAILFALSFFVPPLANQALAHAGRNPIKEAQLQMLEELKQELAAKEQLPQEVEEIIKKLEEMQQKFEKGEIAEREVMLELGRLDESLKEKLNLMGVENLESELNALVPHLSANAATLQVAQAIKDRKLDLAAEELKELSDKVSEDKFSPEEMKKLAAQLGTAATKLGKKSTDSFSGDLAEASEALEGSDCEGFASACKNIGDKLGLVGKCQGLKSVCNSLGLCKGGLGQCDSQTAGYVEGPKTEGNKKGGLKAGTAASGNPFGDPSRLNDSLAKMLQISGQLGKGPMQTETEVTDGQLSDSKLSTRDLHASYAAMAEEVIEREDIPLSKRYHVKRYFQAIKPQE